MLKTHLQKLKKLTVTIRLQKPNIFDPSNYEDMSSETNNPSKNSLKTTIKTASKPNILQQNL